jgi:transcriptional regulator with XRE-family HTH domain
MNIRDARKKLKIKEARSEDKTMEDLAVEIGTMVTELRILKGITQDNLAERIGTKQPSIARLENGSYLPNLSTLYKIAKSMDTYLLVPRFDTLERESIATTIVENPNASFEKRNRSLIDQNQCSPGSTIKDTIFNSLNLI